MSAAADLFGGNRGEAADRARGGAEVNEGKVDFQEVDIPFDPPILVQIGKRSFVELI